MPQRLKYLCTEKKIFFQVVFKLDRLSFGKPDLHREKKRSCIQCTNWKWFCYHKLQIGTSSLHFTFTPTTTASLSPFSAITTRAGAWLVRYRQERYQSQREPPRLNTEQTMREGISQVSGSRHFLEPVSQESEGS